MDRVLIHSIGCLATFAPGRAGPSDPAGLLRDCSVLVEGERIAQIISEPRPAIDAGLAINAAGGCVIPGLVDCHTHLVFAGSRADEFALRCAGAGYLEIARAGGGIASTVRATREASDDLLFELASARAREALALGVTTLEAKSGYGLDTRTELRQIGIAARVGRELPVDIVCTFLGAHAVPPELAGTTGGSDRYLDLVVCEMLPAVKEQGIASICDVFCDPAGFTPVQTRRVLDRARELGFSLKLHADEFADTGGAMLAAEYGCLSADHLHRASPEGLAAMAAAGVVAVLLPGAALCLDLPHAKGSGPAAADGLELAIATDFNPGSCCSQDLWLMVSLGCLFYGLSPAAAVGAVTRGAARALGLVDRGTIEPGMVADLVVTDAPDLAHLPYRLGRNPAQTVVKHGRIVYSADGYPNREERPC